MKKSLVGDPIIWPGLIYSPINTDGLIYALGTVSSTVGLIFEEFLDDGLYAVCRRKTDAGWERINVAFSVLTSKYDISEIDLDYVDLLICWKHDSDNLPDIPLIVLSEMMGSATTGKGQLSVNKKLENIFNEDPSRDLKIRADTRQSFEDTVQDLDNRIKKLKGNQ